MLKNFTEINNRLKPNKSNFSKAIRFDEIHTSEKQLNLDKMMQLVNNDIKNIKNKNKKLKKCPICQASNLLFFVKKYEFKMDKCQSCGLIFCNPYPSKQQIYHYYNSETKKFENDFFMKNILVTGGAGYIGSHTCLSLLSKSYTVFVIDSFINSSSNSVFRYSIS